MSIDHMKQILLLAATLLSSFLLRAQYYPVTPKTIVVTKDTFINRILPKASYPGGNGVLFLICPGVKVYFMDTGVSNITDTFLLQPGAELYLDSIYTPAFKYPTILAAPNCIFEARDSFTNPLVIADSSATIRGNRTYVSRSKWIANSSGDYYDFSYWPTGKDPCGRGTAGMRKHADRNEMSIFPNPSTGSFTVKGILKGAQVEILDITGRIMLFESFQDDAGLQIQMERQKGIFLIRLMENGSSTSFRIIME